MGKKGPTKRQHYVPQMILRRFSDDQKHINLITLADGKRRNGAKIAGQCQEDYFYGEDNILEKAFSIEEGKTARLLGDLSREHLSSLSSDDLHDLRVYVAYQRARTAGEVEHMNQQVTSFMRKVAETSAKLNAGAEFDESDAGGFKVSVDGGGAYSVKVHAKGIPILFDLELKFIVAERQVGFLMGDNPVVAYNQFAEHHPILGRYPNSTAMALKGLQLFMPVSPSVTVALFDPIVYKYGGNGLFCSAGPADVLALNKMQAINAMSCVYLKDDRVDEATVESIKKARKWHRSIYEKISRDVMEEGPNDTKRQLVVTYGVDLRVGAKLSFAKVLDGLPYDTYQGPSIPVRSQRMLDFVMKYREEIDRIDREARDRRGDVEQ